MIDALDRLTNAAVSGQDMKVAQDLIGELGGSALLVGGVDRSTGTPNWVRTTMRQDFLEHYFEERFIDGDPFISHLKASMAPILAVPGSLTEQDPVSPLSLRLNQSLYDAGYRALYGVVLPGKDPGERIVATFCTEEGPELLQSEEDGARIRAALTMIGSYVGPPATEEEDFAQYERLRRLSAREREVLQLLADGHRNDRIADYLGLSEVTVRKHFRSARLKLGAATRDQALAIAARRGIVEL